MKLIPNWQSAWRFSSVIAGLLLGFLNIAIAKNWFGMDFNLSVEQFAMFNAVIASILMPFLRIIQQTPPVSPEVKDALVQKALDTPVKETP